MFSAYGTSNQLRSGNQKKGNEKTKVETEKKSLETLNAEINKIKIPRTKQLTLYKTNFSV